ncbi:MAG: hypothetical protein JRJ15_10725 [Deltaproteobacteria bacterium]|nr:hypothetical protein [Deltaproteobacteria bacterium]
MPEETMTSNERVAAAIKLDKPDRVPVVPLLPPEPIAVGGMPHMEVPSHLSSSRSSVVIR